MNKKKEILQKIKSIKKGILFDCDTFISGELKRGDITVIFCELKKAGEIKSLTKGVFYKPEFSSFGLGELPLNKEELLRYFSRKLDAHISGQYGYNLLGLTEQNAQTITLAGKHPFKEFCIQNSYFKYMKSEIGEVQDKEDLSIAIILDALNNINRVSGRTGNEVFLLLKRIIERMQDSKQNKLFNMVGKYPTRTKYLLSKAMEDSNHLISENLIQNICNKSKYEIEYKHTVSA